MRHYETGQRTIGHVLADKAAAIGGRPFLRYSGQVITYGELDEMTNRYAHGFASRGIQRGEHVAMMMPNSPEFLYALWGLGKLGAVAVPLNTAAKGELLSYFLTQSDSTALCVAEPLLERAGSALAMAAEHETLLRHLSEDPGVAEGLAAFTGRRAPDFSGARA